MRNDQSERGLAEVLRWRLVGPHRGGRVVAVSGVRGDPATWYLGACAGGVWKTRDAGLTWRNVSDGFFRTAAVGAIAISDADANVIYAGTGEACIRSNVSHGDGVYRSLDSGETWTNVGLGESGYVGKIRIHPEDPDIVYVAALGHLWGPNSERGIYRSTDGGRRWEKVLFIDENTGGIDISLDPLNSRVVYAALWEVRRLPWYLSSGGAKSGLYRSIDGGESWANVSESPGFAASPLGRIGVAVSPAQAGRVWALVEAADSGLFLSDDRGATWTMQSNRSDLMRRPHYFTHVVAHPANPATVFVLNYQAWRSIDAGRNFDLFPMPHEDAHDLWIDPSTPRQMIAGTDGGAHVSLNAGGSWTHSLGQPTAQLYHVSTDSQIPYRIYASQQDDRYALSLPSISLHGAISTSEWEAPGGGESGWIVPKPDDPNVVIGGATGNGPGNGRLIRYDRRSGQMQNISVWPDFVGKAVGAEGLRYRFNFTFPVLFSRHDPNVLYVAANLVFRSTDLGDSWEPISPDLTRDDRTKMASSGGAITPFNDDEDVYCTIFSLAESQHEPGTLWTGSDDGLIHLRRTHEGSWRNVTPGLLPEWTVVTSIEESPHQPGTAFITGTRYKLDDPRPLVFKTADWGETWQPVTAGLPRNAITRVIRADPVKQGLLYCGTESGVMFSTDDGEMWRSLPSNLPVCPIYDLVVEGSDLVAATHGRSIWILDDLTPLRQLDRASADGPIGRLLEIRPTTRYRVIDNPAVLYHVGQGINYRRAGPVTYSYELRQRPGREPEEAILDAGENPPNGAIITYQLLLDAEHVDLRVRDSQGRTLRALGAAPGRNGRQASLPCFVGFHRITWDLRSEPAIALLGDATTQRLLRGPIVAPGIYEVVLTVDGHEFARSLQVSRDPRLGASEADLEEQFQLLRQIRDKLSEVHARVAWLRDIRTQMRDLLNRPERWAGEATDKLRSSCRELDDQLVQIESDLVQVPTPHGPVLVSRLNERLGILASIADSADARPTRQMYEAFSSLEARINERLAELIDLVDRSVREINQTASDAGVPILVAGR